MTTTLYYPAKEAELLLIEQSGWKRFPSRQPEKLMFYPTLHEAFAIEIATEWTVPIHGKGYVIRLEVSSDFLKAYPAQKAPGAGDDKLSIRIEDLADMNDHIVGLMEVIHRYE